MAEIPKIERQVSGEEFRRRMGDLALEVEETSVPVGVQSGGTTIRYQLAALTHVDPNIVECADP